MPINPHWHRRDQAIQKYLGALDKRKFFKHYKHIYNKNTISNTVYSHVDQGRRFQKHVLKTFEDEHRSKPESLFSP